MIFVTVGVQLPFDRLIRAVDDWAGRQGRQDIIAQGGASSYVPNTIQMHDFLSPNVFRTLVERAELVVAHAGMGSIITAFELGKSIIILPRLAALGEHRSDHQLATARRMAAHANVRVAEDEQALVRMLDEFRAPQGDATTASPVSETLLAEIAAFVCKQSEHGWSRLIHGAPRRADGQAGDLLEEQGAHLGQEVGLVHDIRQPGGLDPGWSATLRHWTWPAASSWAKAARLARMGHVPQKPRP